MLVDFAQDKRVVHVGFVDEKRMEDKLGRRPWLHERLRDAATSIVGLDVSEDGVRWAKEQGFDAHAVDAQSPDAVAGLGLEQADVVIAGEVIEHLDAPGPFLHAMTALRSVPTGCSSSRRRTPTGCSTSSRRRPAASSSTPTTRPGTARTRFGTCSNGAGGTSKAPPTTATPPVARAAGRGCSSMGSGASSRASGASRPIGATASLCGQDLGTEKEGR